MHEFEEQPELPLWFTLAALAIGVFVHLFGTAKPAPVPLAHQVG
jgi:hypothetical protein